MIVTDKMNIQEKSKEEYIARINQVLDYIEKNLGQRLVLKNIAEVANYSPYHFHKIFKYINGETLYKYIQRIRIEKAVEWMKKDPSMPVVEIAEICGFGNISMLNRVFKKYFGITASQFRKAQKEMKEKMPRKNGETTIEKTVIRVLLQNGANFIHFIDIKNFSPAQNRGLPKAILFGFVFTYSNFRRGKINFNDEQIMVTQNLKNEDEFYQKEHKAGNLSNLLASMLSSMGYQSYPLSDENLIATGAWDDKNLKTVMPLQKVAVLSGMGWIGKNNLLVTSTYGSALCLGAVFTDAPLAANPLMIKENKCGACMKCINICPTKALFTTSEDKHLLRDDTMDVHQCILCMKCLIYCPYTIKYLNYASINSKKRHVE